MEYKELIKIFLSGLTLGTTLCMLWCLPILLPYISAKGTDWKGGLKLTIMFSISRIIAYTLLGLLATIAFKFLDRTLRLGEKYIYLILGILILIIGITYLLGKKFQILYNFLYRPFVEKSKYSMFLLGFLTALSPCGPFLGILTYIACMAESPFWGMIGGFSFGIGTFISPLIPLGAISGLFSSSLLSSPKIFTILRLICGLILFYFGLRLIVISRGGYIF